MVEIRTIVACVEHGLIWPLEADPAPCSDSGHDHRTHRMHRHRDVLALPDGSDITAVSFDPLDPYQRVHMPDFGLYLDRRWQPSWPHRTLDWPDFGVPDDPSDAVTALHDLHRRSVAGERVEIGCLGGHGRTGTALALLTRLVTEMPADEAIGWVRQHYCSQAIETADQEALVGRVRS